MNIKSKIKKSVKFVILTLLVGIFVISGTGCSCGKDNNDSKVNDPDVQFHDKSDVELETTHIRSVESADGYVMKNNEILYDIVLSSKPTENEGKVAGIINNFFYKATNQTLQVNKEPVSDAVKHISIGNTALARENAVEYEFSEESKSGYQIITKDKNIYLVGGPQGILYSAFDLLKEWFGLEYYAEFCYKIDENVEDIPLMNYSITEIPDFEYRMWYVNGISIYSEDPYYNTAMRWQRDQMMGCGHIWHNSYFYVPWYDEGKDRDEFIENYKAKYNKTECHYREWYSPKEAMGQLGSSNRPVQLCYSRYADEYLPVALDNLKDTVEKFPELDIFTFVHQDVGGWCECEECTRQKELYGSDSGVYIKFLNKLAEGARQMYDNGEIDRPIKIAGMAYHATEIAPIKYNEETKDYELTSPDVMLDPDVYMIYCPARVQFDKPLDAEGYELDYATLKAWGKMASKLIIYSYCQRMYSDYLQFSDLFGTMHHNYELFLENKATYLIDLGQYNVKKSTGFETLRAYLNAKLGWNVKQEPLELVDDFFNNYYGEASTSMRRIFDALRGRYYQIRSLSSDKKLPDNIVTKEIYPYGFVNTLKGYLDDAYKAIEPLKTTSPEEYKNYYERICLDGLCVRYAEIKLYIQEYSPENQKKIKLAFKEDATRIGLTMYGEHTDINELWENWGIA